MTETRTRVEEIIWCEGQADQVLADAERDADALRWTAARLIAEELDAGRTQRDVAADIGKSHVHVGFMYQVHKIAGGNPGYQERSFNECYQEVKSRPRDETRETVRELHEDQGLSKEAVSKKLGIPRTTVRKLLDEVEEQRPREPIPARPGDTCSGFNVASIMINAVKEDLDMMAEVQTWTQKDVDRARKYLNAALRKLNTIEKGL